MAHNIARYNGKDMVFTGRGIPAWHQLAQLFRVATWKSHGLASLNWKVKACFTITRAIPSAWGIFGPRIIPSWASW